MTWKINGNEIADALKKIGSVTKASIVHLHFKENNVNIKSAVNQYLMCIDIPVECDINEKFSIDIDTLLTLVKGKKEILLQRENQTLKFKSGKFSGQLVVSLYDDFEVLLEGGTPLSKDLQTYMFDNISRVDFDSSNAKTIALQVQIKDKKFKMMAMESYYSGLLVENIESEEENSFNILLRYATLISSIFNKNDNLCVMTTPSTVEITSNNCKISLPRIAEDQANSIEETEEMVKKLAIPEDFLGSATFEDPKTLLSDLNELLSFCGSGTNPHITIEGKENGQAILKVDAKVGSLKKELERCEVKGIFNIKTYLENLKLFIEKNQSCALQLRFYKSFVLLKSKMSKDSIYVLSVIA